MFFAFQSKSHDTLLEVASPFNGRPRYGRQAFLHSAANETRPLGVVPATMLRSIRTPQSLGHCSDCRALLVIWLLLISCQSNYRLLNAMLGLSILKAAQRLELRPSQVHGHHFSAVLPHNVAPTRANQTIVGLNA